MKTITFKRISNESQLENVTIAASKAKCSYEVLDYSTKVIVKGTTEQLAKFVKTYNQ